MKQVLIAASVALAGFVGTGCNNSPPGGSPGSTFKLKGPDLTTTVKQGETKVVDLTVDRDTNFKETVKLDTKTLPKGVKAELSKSSVPASEKDVKLTITADKDAALGEHVITVTAKPENGTATEVGVKIDVKAP